MSEDAIFDMVINDPWDWVARYKQETGKMVVGVFPMHVPLEIIHAAGALPITLIARTAASASIDSLIQPYLCGPIKKGLSLGLEGRIDFLDGIVVPDICDAVPLTSDLWRRHKSPRFFFHLPVPKNLEVMAWRDETIRQYTILKENLEQALGKEITTSAITESIKVYNEQRRLLRELYNLRKANPAALSSQRLAEIVYATMFLPVELANDALTSLVTELSAQSAPVAAQASNGTKILVCANLCEEPEEWVYETLTDFGAEVIDDYTYVGRIYFDISPEDLPAEPLAALADRYFKVACPTKHNSQNHWVDRVTKLAVENKAQGVLLVNPKFCEPVFFDYPYLSDSVNNLGIPLLSIETDDDESSIGQFKTRLQAFVEMIRV